MSTTSFWGRDDVYDFLAQYGQVKEDCGGCLYVSRRTPRGVISLLCECVGGVWVAYLYDKPDWAPIRFFDISDAVRVYLGEP